MKTDYLRAAKGFLNWVRLGGYRRKETVAVGLVCVSFFAAGVIAVKLGDVVVTTVAAGSLVKRITAEGNADANDVEKFLAGRKEIADELKRKNAFAPPPAKKHPVENVLGILGSEALINGKWHKVGDSIEDAKIIAIEATQVKIEWQGEEKSFAPISSKGSSGGAEAEKKDRKRGGGERRREGRRRMGRERRPEREEKSGSGEEDPLAWMGVELSPGARAKILEVWNNASDEEKEKMKEEWNKMSDEQKQQAVESMG